MSYIRTKDGNIYDTLNCVGKYYVVNQADTIEELCDAFVIVPKDKNIKPYTTNTLAEFDDVTSLLDTNDVYGAIWIQLDSGAPRLEPVAKLNEKEGLCLL